MRNLSEILGSVIVIAIMVTSIVSLYMITQNSLKKAISYSNYESERIYEEYNRPLMSISLNNSNVYLTLFTSYPINISYIIINEGNYTIIKDINKMVNSSASFNLIKDYNCSKNLSIYAVTGDGVIYQYNPYFDPNLNKNLNLQGLNYFSCDFLRDNTPYNYSYNLNKIIYSGYYIISLNPPLINYDIINPYSHINFKISGSLNNNLNAKINVNNSTIYINGNGITKVYNFYIRNLAISLYLITIYESPYFMMSFYLYSPNISYYNLIANEYGIITFTANFLQMPILLNNAPVIAAWSFNSKYSGSFIYSNILINGANNEATYQGKGSVYGNIISPGLLLFYYSNIASSQTFAINGSIIINSIWVLKAHKSYQVIPYAPLFYNSITLNQKLNNMESLLSYFNINDNSNNQYILFETNVGNVSRIVKNYVQLFQADYNHAYLVSNPQEIIFSTTIPGYILNKTANNDYYLILKEANISPTLFSNITLINISNGINKGILLFTPLNQFIAIILSKNLTINDSNTLNLIDGITYDTTCKYNIFYPINNFVIENNDILYNTNFSLNVQNGLYLYQCYYNETMSSFNLAYVS
ncbi:MAG: hypothetical protein ACP5I6_01395 [Caldisphaera sp.]|jgi:hypothetical protein|nr:MAG: hypothetical protein C0171_02860 [Caldisphaera sp.]